MKLHPSATLGIAVLVFMCTAFSKSKSEGEVFEWKPQSVATIVGMPATFECGRSSGGYEYFFTYSLPSGASVNIDDSTENQEGGGIKLTVRFIATAELNNTEVTCHAVGATSHSTTAIFRVQQIPVISAGNVRVCQISEKVVFNWPNVFALPGIKVQYKLFVLEEEHNTTENKFYMNYTRSTTTQNEGRIAIILTLRAGQIVEGNRTSFPYTLNDMKTLSVDKALLSKRKDMVDFEFIVDLKLPTNDQCSFDTDLEENAIMIYCNESTAGQACNHSNAMIKYENGKLRCNTTLNLLNQKFDSKVCFYYSGQHIETSSVPTSTHEIQNISIISNNCLNVTLISGFNISSIHLKLESSKETIIENISLSSLCPFDGKTFNISIERGNWTVLAYDSIRTEPAFILREVAINLKDVPSSGTVVKATAHLGLAVFFLLLIM